MRRVESCGSVLLIFSRDDYYDTGQSGVYMVCWPSMHITQCCVDGARWWRTGAMVSLTFSGAHREWRLATRHLQKVGNGKGSEPTSMFIRIVILNPIYIHTTPWPSPGTAQSVRTRRHRSLLLVKERRPSRRGETETVTDLLARPSRRCILMARIQS